MSKPIKKEVYHQSVDRALKSIIAAMKQLRELGVLNNKKDLTCQLGEWFVKTLYNGQYAPSSNNKYWDIKIGQRRIQVKAHAKADTNKNRFTRIKYDEKAEVDELITVVFTQDYQLKHVYKTPWPTALGLIRRNKSGNIIRWNSQREYEMDIRKLPKPELIALFK